MPTVTAPTERLSDLPEPCGSLCALLAGPERPPLTEGWFGKHLPATCW